MKRKRAQEKRKRQKIKKNEEQRRKLKKEEGKEVSRKEAQNRKAVDSDDKAFAASIKSGLGGEHRRGYPHMEWDGSTFTPTPPSPSPRMDVKVSMMHTAHEKFGMKWKGSRKGAYKPHTVTTLADSGCQTSTAGIDLLEEIGCPITYLIPTTHRIMGITKLSLDLIGSVLLRIEYGGVVTRQMVHISRNTNGLYLSKTALMDLGLIDRNFPLPPASAANIDISEREMCDRVRRM